MEVYYYDAKVFHMTQNNHQRELTPDNDYLSNILDHKQRYEQTSEMKRQSFLRQVLSNVRRQFSCSRNLYFQCF
jgi:hypothetical protein